MNINEDLGHPSFGFGLCYALLKKVGVPDLQICRRQAKQPVNFKYVHPYAYHPTDSSKWWVSQNLSLSWPVPYFEKKRPITISWFFVNFHNMSHTKHMDFLI